ncbi:MAG TPA: amino acid ABC transporter permease [Candidatus Intestinimonas pullistercoris]|mgnify:FL=1|uniref:Amino acid ABC transporter permease n=1 Tax=Candidatus Intestinimonas pullistercoris TaxID=2838623 RepID=A0A9D2T0I2_9FIRM|nr:amino acid ABC transporter permease [uncultured Intestinimonas sp.]HJC40635.1 amino acid ABC transporter permease [Candidatus Intestinimonas pullistercoris]
MFEIFQASLPYLISGSLITVRIWAISIALGVVLGLVTCLMRISPFRPLRAVAWVYIWIIRGTPMLVQAMVVYFGIPQVTGLRLTPFTAGIITLCLNAGAYLAEIFRSGIQAVPKGQSEAARSLGLGAGRTMAKIVLPQAFKIAIPPMVNQFIITLKDTSILTVIGLPEIMNEAQQYVMIRWEYFQTYVIAAAYYLVVTSLLMVLANYVEKKISYDRKGNRS